jgi:hypothetical protein
MEKRILEHYLGLAEKMVRLCRMTYKEAKKAATAEEFKPFREFLRERLLIK